MPKTFKSSQKNALCAVALTRGPRRSIDRRGHFLTGSLSRRTRHTWCITQVTPSYTSANELPTTCLKCTAAAAPRTPRLLTAKSVAQLTPIIHPPTTFIITTFSLGQGSARPTCSPHAHREPNPTQPNPTPHASRRAHPRHRPRNDPWPISGRSSRTRSVYLQQLSGNDHVSQAVSTEATWISQWCNGRIWGQQVEC